LEKLGRRKKENFGKKKRYINVNLNEGIKSILGAERVGRRKGKRTRASRKSSVTL